MKRRTFLTGIIAAMLSPFIPKTKATGSSGSRTFPDGSTLHTQYTRGGQSAQDEFWKIDDEDDSSDGFYYQVSVSGGAHDPDIKVKRVYKK